MTDEHPRPGGDQRAAPGDTEPMMPTVENTEPSLPAAAKDYAAPRPLPSASEPRTLDNVRVRLAEDIDPQQAATLPSLRVRGQRHRRRRVLLVLAAVLVVGGGLFWGLRAKPPKSTEASESSQLVAPAPSPPVATFAGAPEVASVFPPPPDPMAPSPRASVAPPKKVVAPRAAGAGSAAAPPTPSAAPPSAAPSGRKPFF